MKMPWCVLPSGSCCCHSTVPAAQLVNGQFGASPAELIAMYAGCWAQGDRELLLFESSSHFLSPLKPPRSFLGTKLFMFFFLLVISPFPSTCCGNHRHLQLTASEKSCSDGGWWLLTCLWAALPKLARGTGDHPDPGWPMEVWDVKVHLLWYWEKVSVLRWE